jgi:hypothetical protein
VWNTVPWTLLSCVLGWSGGSIYYIQNWWLLSRSCRKEETVCCTIMSMCTVVCIMKMDCVCLVGWCVTCCDVKEECTSVDGSNEIEKETGSWGAY